MALIWSKTVADTRYEVRGAGNTVRLYTNGVFHSQFNPDKPLCGGIWDLLILPALMYHPHSFKRILVLGVGGGTVIHQIRRYLMPDEVIGIELNPVHLGVARRHFGVSPTLATLVESDAVEWMAHYTGDKFDLIIEDLFGGDEGGAVRAITGNNRWFKQLTQHLSPHGLLVMNFLSHQDLMTTAGAMTPERFGFKQIYRLSRPQFVNVIGAFCRSLSSSTQLRRRLEKTTGLNAFLKLDYRIWQVK